MIVSLIAALDKMRGIGRDGRLPWHLSSDLKRFKSLTNGHHIVMGRKTYQSIGKPLPGRTSVIITRSMDFEADGCVVVHSLEEALEFARNNGEEEVFVIGGGELFVQSLPVADRLYLTTVEAVVDADVFFPALNLEEWQVGATQLVSAGPNDDYDHTYAVYRRINKDRSPIH